MAQLETALGSDKSLIDLWSNIQGDALWKGRTGRGVRVGIVDSGVDTAHPELAGKIKASYQAVNEGGQIVFKESTSGDQAGHALKALFYFSLSLACAGLWGLRFARRYVRASRAPAIPASAVGRQSPAIATVD